MEFRHGITFDCQFVQIMVGQPPRKGTSNRAGCVYTHAFRWNRPHHAAAFLQYSQFGRA